MNEKEEINWLAIFFEWDKKSEFSFSETISEVEDIPKLIKGWGNIFCAKEMKKILEERIKFLITKNKTDLGGLIAYWWLTPHMFEEQKGLQNFIEEQMYICLQNKFSE